MYLELNKIYSLRRNYLFVSSDLLIILSVILSISDNNKKIAYTIIAIIIIDIIFLKIFNYNSLN